MVHWALSFLSFLVCQGLRPRLRYRADVLPLPQCVSSPWLGLYKIVIIPGSQFQVLLELVSILLLSALTPFAAAIEMNLGGFVFAV